LILIAFILFENCCRNIVEIPKVYNETRLWRITYLLNILNVENMANNCWCAEEQ
jgi:hypothetical protein